MYISSIRYAMLYVIVKCYNLKMKTDENFLESFSLFTCICTKSVDSTPLQFDTFIVSEK